MTTAIYEDPTTWEMDEDDEGHREYHIEFKIRADKTDGPFNVRNTPGLPLPGGIWQFFNDIDPAATCKRDTSVRPMQSQDEATDLWRVKFKFSTKPDKRCQDFKFEDPLTEPPKISGSWTKDKKEATTNRFGIPLKNSVHESLKGPRIEFDEGLQTVRIEQNVIDLNLPLLAAMVHCVNSVPLWDLPIRCVKLSGVSWSQEFYGSCYKYYKRTLEFDLNPDTFDRKIADEGTKVLYGRWEKPGTWRLLCIDGGPPDNKNPAHFIDFTFPNGNPGTAQLNGKGLPVGVCVVWDECASVATSELSSKMANCPGVAAEYVEEIASAPSPYYMSLWNNNRGISLANETVWIQIYGSITPAAWSPQLIYPRGSLVLRNGEVWVAVADSRGIEPTDADGGAHWVLVGTQADLTGTGTDHTLDDRGVYDPCRFYQLGEYVTYPGGNYTSGTGPPIDCNKTEQGFITVEKYSEANFLLLGVPAAL